MFYASVFWNRFGGIFTLSICLCNRMFCTLSGQNFHIFGWLPVCHTCKTDFVLFNYEISWMVERQSFTWFEWRHIRKFVEKWNSKVSLFWCKNFQNPWMWGVFRLFMNPKFQIFFYLAIFETFINFFCLITLAVSLTVILRESGKTRHLCNVSACRWETFDLSPLNI